MSVLAVIPSMSSARGPALKATVSDLTSLGFTVRIVANSRSLADWLGANGVDYISDGVNSGFGSSIMKGVEASPSCSWILILNDDVKVDDSALLNIHDDLAVLPPKVGMAYLDQEPDRSIPGAVEVFHGLSLLSVATRRLPTFRDRALSPANEAANGTYKSFSAVFIRHEVWDELSGFNRDMPFTYEDADFVRRASLAGYDSVTFVTHGFSHEHSASTKSNIDTVLPVMTWSARAYLTKWSGLSRWTITALLVSALLLRLLILPFSTAPVYKHYVGVRTALISLLRSEQPLLPKFDAN